MLKDGYRIEMRFLHEVIMDSKDIDRDADLRIMHC